MPVSNSTMGKILGVLQKIWGLFKDGGTSLAAFFFGTGAVNWLLALATGFGGYTLGWNMINDLLEAGQTLDADFVGAMSGAVGSNSISDILEKANYYFPIDTLGSLSLTYVSLWCSVNIYKGAKELAKTVNTVVGTFK